MNATTPDQPHKYNPVGPAGYLITFRTYGTWLQGDDRGSMDRKDHNIPGTPVMSADPVRERRHAAYLKQQPVTLTAVQRSLVDSCIVGVCEHNRWILHARTVQTEHAHMVLTAPKAPELVMNSMKSWCTRKMREGGFWQSPHSPWSRHGSTRYLWNERDVRDACTYVMYGQT